MAGTRVNIRRCICLVLCVSMFFTIMSLDVFATNTEEIYEMSFECQYVIEHTVNQVSVSGVMVSGIYYVSPDIIAQLTGCRWWLEESDVYFIPERIYHRYCLNLADGKLREENLYIADRSWDIPMYENGHGEMLVALEPMLEAMNARVAYDETEKIPLSVYLPYTVLDGRYDLKNELLFQWTEADVEKEDEKSNVILSAFNALYLDYSEHFIIDTLFAWWNDDILTVTEEQYLDAFTEILTCLSDENSVLEDDLYENYTLQNDVFGLTSDMYELMGLNLEEIKALGKYAEVAQYGQILIEHVDLYMTYKSVNENQRKMIETVFVNPPENTVLGSKELKSVRNAASHVQALIGGNVLSGATAICDAIAELSAKTVEGTVSAITPVLIIVDGMATLLNILPSTSKLTDINATALRAGHCDALVGCASDSFNYFNQKIKNEGTPDETMLDNIKQSMLFMIRGTIATRKVLLNCDVLELTEANTMRQKNKELINLLAKIETSTTQMAPTQLSEEYCIIKKVQEQEDNVFNDSPGGFVLENPYPEEYQMNETALDNLFSGHFANMSAPMGLESGCTYEPNIRFAIKASYDKEDPVNGAHYLMIVDVLGNVYDMIPVSKYPKVATGWLKDDVFYCSDGSSACIMKQGGDITDNFFEDKVSLIDVVNDSNGIHFFTAETVFDSPYDSENSFTDIKYKVWDELGNVVLCFYKNEIVNKYGIDSWVGNGSYHLQNIGNGVYHVSNRYNGNNDSAQYIFIDVNRQKAFAVPTKDDARYETIESDGNYILIPHQRTEGVTIFDINSEKSVCIENVSEAYSLGEERFFTDKYCYSVQGDIIFANEDLDSKDEIEKISPYHGEQALIIFDCGKYYQSREHEYGIGLLNKNSDEADIITTLDAFEIFYSYVQEIDTYCIFTDEGCGGFLINGNQFLGKSVYSSSESDCYYGVVDNGNPCILRYGHIGNDYSDEISVVAMFGYELFTIN